MASSNFTAQSEVLKFGSILKKSAPHHQAEQEPEQVMEDLRKAKLYLDSLQDEYTTKRLSESNLLVKNRFNLKPKLQQGHIQKSLNQVKRLEKTVLSDNLKEKDNRQRIAMMFNDR